MRSGGGLGVGGVRGLPGGLWIALSVLPLQLACEGIGHAALGEGTLCDGNDCDLCPDDFEKLAPGACGCGVADEDLDADGVLDCLDACPGDPAKDAAGACGCGAIEADLDLDGTVDCVDACPEDPTKSSPGACGCGVVDIDGDGDGIADCLNVCPLDSEGQATTECACRPYCPYYAEVSNQDAHPIDAGTLLRGLSPSAGVTWSFDAPQGQGGFLATPGGSRRRFYRPLHVGDHRLGVRSGEQSVEVLVRALNQAPRTAQDWHAHTALAGDLVVLISQAIDDDVEPLVWDWKVSQAPGEGDYTLRAEEGTARFVPAAAGSYVVSARAIDGEGASVLVRHHVNVRACEGCAAVDDYAQLHRYEGEATSLVVTDQRTRGVFHQIDLCFEDRGTCIRSADGRYWLRATECMSPRFWPLGTSVWGWFLEDETLAVAQASRAALLQGVACVELDRIYELREGVWLYEGQTWRGGGLRRACGGESITSEYRRKGVRCVPVESPEGFRRGMVVLFSHPENGESLGLRTIQSLQPDRICLNNGVPEDLPEGTYVSRVHDLLRTEDVLDSAVVESMIFDGGHACHTNAYDWRYNATFGLKGNVTIRHNVFRNTPSENITTCGAHIHDNQGFELGGSFIHKSCWENPPTDLIVNNRLRGTNTVGRGVLGHSEAVHTFSANAGEQWVAGNIYYEGREPVWGIASVEDENVYAEENLFVSFPALLEIDPNHPSPESFVIDDAGFVSSPADVP